MKKLALCVGINSYPHAPLNGCVNDARAWSALLEQNGYEVVTLLDASATKAAIMAGLQNMIDRARFGDRIVFSYSGHGTWVPDRDGDEADWRDEALCPYDYETKGVIIDDALQATLAAKRFGVRATIFSDSCHSGTVSRFAGPTNGDKPKFVHPSTFLPNLEVIERLDRQAPRTAPRRIGAASVLFSGCDDPEYSYDAFIDGRAQGAFTAAAMGAYQECRSLGLPATYSRWHRIIREVLPSTEYPQTPQMYASLWQRRWEL